MDASRHLRGWVPPAPFLFVVVSMAFLAAGASFAMTVTGSVAMHSTHTEMLRTAALLFCARTLHGVSLSGSDPWDSISSGKSV